MTDSFGPFDGQLWSTAQWYRHAAKWAPSAVNGTPVSSAGSGDLPLTFSGLTATIGNGRAWVRGAGFERTTPATIAVPVNTNASLSRRDRIVLRRDIGAQTVAPVLIQGTPAASPTPPAMQRSDAGQWDLSLFSFLVPPSSGTSISGIIDERAWHDGSGTVSVYDSAGNGALLALSSSGGLADGTTVWEAASGRPRTWDGAVWTWPRGAQGEIGYVSRASQAGPAATLGAWVPVSGLAVTFTIPGTRKIKLTWSGQLFSDQAGTEVAARINITTTSQTKPTTADVNFDNYGVGTTIVMRESMAAGTYNAQIEIMRLAGPGSAFLTSDVAELIVEDMGGPV